MGPHKYVLYDQCLPVFQAQKFHGGKGYHFRICGWEMLPIATAVEPVNDAP